MNQDPSKSPWAWVISCEHATNHIPPRWQHLFTDPERLESHRGWDPGAAGVARHLGRHLEAPVHLASVSRLLADCNRSSTHPKVHDEIIRSLPERERAEIIATWHAPYQQQICTEVETKLATAKRVIHVSCHSFTPVLDEQRRNTDVGLLYDPAHPGEAAFARCWQHALSEITRFRVRRNYPYRGRDDGMTRILRRRFKDRVIAFEIELNQALLEAEQFPPELCDALLLSLRDTAAGAE